MTDSTDAQGQGVTPTTLGISDDLLAILVCPVDHASLKAEQGDLVCTKCGRHFPVKDGIPNMVVE